MLLKKLIRRGLLLSIFCQLLFSANAQQILTLEKALEIARTNSPDIRRSLLNLERSEQSLKAQNAALKSKFLLNLTPFSYNRSRSFDSFNSVWNTNTNTESFGTFSVSQPFLPTDGTISLINRFGWQNNTSEYKGNLENRSFSNNLYLSINQPLFTYNRTKLELKGLELDLENAQLSYAMQKLNMEKQVTQFFYNVYLAQMKLSVSQDEFANTQKSYEITQNKVTAGIAAREELYQAELNFATARSNVQNAQVTLENYKDQFKQYIGMDIMDEIAVMTDVNFNPVEVDIKKALEHGLNSRMEIRQREINVENSQFTLIQTKGLNEFKGDLNLSIGIIGDDEKLQNIYQNPTNNPKVSVSFNVPIFDWGEKKARIKAQEAVIETQNMNLDEEKKQITLDIRQVYRSLQNQVSQIDIAAQSEKNAQLTYEINLERYANGDLTSMDLNLFQTQLSTKKMAYAQALIDYKIELLNLKIQSLFDFEKNEAIVPENLIQKKRP
jgi:outer membrane protein TolC